MSYSLAADRPNVASGLFALDATDIETADSTAHRPGRADPAQPAGNVITGTVGAITNYFTHQHRTPATGVVTFTQTQNSGTPTPATMTIPQTLTLTDPSLLQVVQTVTDADGDTDTASHRPRHRRVPVQDDGPDAVVVNATAGGDCAGRERRLRRTATAIVSATGGLRGDGNFAATLRRTDFGTDGAGQRGAIRWC